MIDDTNLTEPCAMCGVDVDVTKYKNKGEKTVCNECKLIRERATSIARHMGIPGKSYDSTTLAIMYRDHGYSYTKKYLEKSVKWVKVKCSFCHNDYTVPEIRLKSMARKSYCKNCLQERTALAQWIGQRGYKASEWPEEVSVENYNLMMNGSKELKEKFPTDKPEKKTYNKVPLPVNRKNKKSNERELQLIKERKDAGIPLCLWEVQMLAREAGLSYGQYVGLYL